MQTRVFTQQDIASLLPQRKEDAHKGDFGRILLLCGSRGYTGAAYLAAMGALRSGAGLVYLAVPESIYTIEAVKLNEAIVLPLPDANGCYHTSASSQIRELLPQMDAVLIGCGMGLQPDCDAILQLVLEEATCPLVIDADGLSLLSKHLDSLKNRPYPSILTPHLGEYRRLSPTLENPVNFAKENHCILLLKGHHSQITDGTSSYRNETGNPGMAVGGSGDLLAGMIAALLGQKIAPLEAAACATWLHGKVGDLCAEALGQYAMLPTDMLDFLPQVLK